jgi:hypothetical protein
VTDLIPSTSAYVSVPLDGWKWSLVDQIIHLLMYEGNCWTSYIHRGESGVVYQLFEHAFAGVRISHHESDKVYPFVIRPIRYTPTRFEKRRLRKALMAYAQNRINQR